MGESGRRRAEGGVSGHDFSRVASSAIMGIGTSHKGNSDGGGGTHF